MVRHASQYIMRNLGWSLLVITISLTGIIWLTQALRFIDFIVNRGVSFATFLHLTVLLIPSLLMLIVPIALFAAVLFIYNKMSGDSELVVMRSAGLSNWQLAKPALAVSLLVTGFGYALSLYFLPATYREFKDMQSFLRDNYASLLLQEEVFNSPVEGLTVFIRERGSDGTLRGLLVHDNRDEETPVTMMAARGELVQTPQGPRFLLYQGNRQELRDGQVSLLNFDAYTLDVSFYTETGTARVREAEERYLPELLNPVDVEPRFRPQMLAEAHQRLTWPLYATGLTLLALSFLLTGDFNRRGQWKRLSVCVAFAIVVMVVTFALVNIIVKIPALVPVIYALSGGLCAFSFYALMDGNRRVPPAPPDAWQAEGAP